MTANEMQYEFEKRTGNLSNFTATHIPSYSIEGLLNLSQDFKLKELYSEEVGRRSRFEGTEKIRRELSNLITRYATTTFDSSSPGRHINGKFVTLPQDYLYTLEERCVLNSAGATALGDVLPITHDEYQEARKNPFLWPDDESIWRMGYGLTGATGARRLELIHSSDVTISSYEVRYIRRPQKIKLGPTGSQDCELDESTHESIINRAVQMVSAKTEN